MNIFVLCGGKGLYSGRVLARQLRARLAGNMGVDCGTAEDLARNKQNNTFYQYVLNTGETDKFNAGCWVLNHQEATMVAANRLKCRMKMKIRHLSAPNLTFKFTSVTTDMLPIIGRPSFSDGRPDFWVCHTLAQVRKADELGASHYVARIENSREFRVHVCAPAPDIHTSKVKDYRVLKISERTAVDAEVREINPADKSKWAGFYFGEPRNMDSTLESILTAAGQEVLKGMQLHWGSITFLVGPDGIPKVSKIDTHISMKEDQVNTMELFSNAICKMIGQVPKPLIRRRPLSCA